MRLALICASLLALPALSTPARAQDAAPRTTLSLTEALDIAKRNNPQYLQSITGQSRARTSLRSAYGAFLPSADASLGMGYREGRQQFFGGVAFGAIADIVSSSWGLSANSRLSYGMFANVKRANAQLDAADADLEAARYTLQNQVSAQFLLALQTAARAAFQDTLVTQQRLQLELARARQGVGAATSLDVMRAEVGLGQQEVAALRARNTAEVTRLQLFQQLGVPMPAGVELTADLTGPEPNFVLAELLTTARRENPALLATLARERVAQATVRSARGEYTPSLSLSASGGGNAQAPVDSAFPSDFTRNPYNLNASLSFPLFDGFAREQRLQDANASSADARYSVRRQELQLTADVTSALVTVQVAHRTVELQTRTAATSRQALQLAEERYRVGANTFVDLTTARAEFERAETDRIDAIYEFHRAYAALESAVGRSLR